MPAGALYLWFMVGCFGLVALLVAVLAVVLYVGHVLHRRRTGSQAGFLEMEAPAAETADDKKEA